MTEKIAHDIHANGIMWAMTFYFQIGGAVVVGVLIVILAAVVLNPIMIIGTIVSKVSLSYHRFSNIPHF